MLQFFRRKIAVWMMVVCSISLTSCDEDTVNDVVDAILKFLGMMGWNLDSENADNQEKSDDTYDENTDGTLPSSVSLERYFPPIGNQGSYGTCVAWATGYNMKTALNAKEKGWSSSDLAKASNQTSPVDLWHLMSSSDKGSGCNGSNFEPAMKTIQSKGVSDMSAVSFSGLKMTCDGVSGVGNSSNKLGQYRIIAYTKDLGESSDYGMNANNFKYWLSKGYPVLIGAQLGERFMSWNSSSVITSDTEGYNGQHAYHAMVCVGYDDNKQAFRVRNSWDSDWGDNGSIWVGYSFFINQFCFGAWVACNSSEVLASAQASPSLRSTGASVDLAAHIVADYEAGNGERTLEYDVLNEGNMEVSANKGWSVVYMLYNTKHLNDKYILMHDYYGTDVTTGEIEAYKDGVAVYKSMSTETNVSVPSGSSVAAALGGKTLKFNYKLPLDKDGNPLNGNFYMVLMVNPFGDLNDMNMDNNYSFISVGDQPIEINNGKILNMPSSLKDVRTLVTEKNWNTYTGVELNNMLLKQKKNGRLNNLVQPETSTLRSTKVAKSVKR
ncbi:MAG: C1 family peptidase [Prevotellaceae bacterium]|nr:C1 family peptidase [Prevotellaceae bacterium]